MKSSDEDLRRRGYATYHDIKLLNGESLNSLLELLHNDNAVIRTASTCNLTIESENEMLIASELLKQLTVEKCLYTKNAVCRKLEQGGIDTASQMIKLLGRIGSNQYKQLPDRSSRKKSYPLPRDIIARSLGRMSVGVYPVLIDVLQCKKTETISEALDAIGYMTFYNKQLSTENNAQAAFNVMDEYSNNSLILWKAIICLSAFPSEKTKMILESFINQNNLLGEEANRSLKLITPQI